MTTKLKPKSCGCYSCRNASNKNKVHTQEQRAHRASQRRVLKEAVKSSADSEELDVDIEVAYHGARNG